MRSVGKLTGKGGLYYDENDRIFFTAKNAAAFG